MVMFLALIAAIVLLYSCSPKIIEKVETKVEIRERVVHDTTTFEIPVEVEKIVTKDTVSHLENSYARSDASVSGGLLSHSLESIPQIIKVPYEVTVTDTVYVEKEAQIIEKEVTVEKPLSLWKRIELASFWWLLLLSAGSLAYIFRKDILKLVLRL